MDIFNEIEFFDIYQKNNYCELDVFEETVLIIQNFRKYKRDFIIIKNNLFQANRLYNEIKSYLNDDEVALFGFDESLVVETIASSPELNSLRLECIKKSLSSKPKIVITHSLGLVKPIIEKKKYQNSILKISKNDKLNFKDINTFLVNSGYEKVSKVTMPLEYSIRGNVIDIYPISSNYPIRIDCFDDEVESIRLFDVVNQRSRIKIDNIEIIPASIYDINQIDNIIYNIEKKINNPKIIDNLKSISIINRDLFLSRYYNIINEKSSIIEYLNNPIIVTSSIDEIKSNIELSLKESYAYLKELYKEEKSIYNYEIFLDYESLINDNIDIKTYRKNLKQISLDLYKIEKSKNQSDFINEITRYHKDGYQIVFCLSKKHDIDNIKKLFTDSLLVNENDIIYHNQYLTRGFVYQNKKIIFYSDNELVYRSKRKTNILNKYSNAVDIEKLEELKENDYIVHNHHGIGQYLGLIQLKVDNIMKDFLHIRYRNDEKLYIPIEQFNMIKKYSSNENIVPKISLLGGSDWKKTKLKVQKRIEDMMDELLELYAIRNESIGFSFIADTSLQKEFENEFEYNLTPDQEKAIFEVKSDMESNKVMDRLICGDVGYGKTEVAIRAIFKAVISNKQAAFLCPTTILSRQHYNTLLERFENYPINVVQVSRNTPNSLFKQIKEDIKNKKIDVVVGTHKLLSKEIEFNDLGLLVIDEEQRFGVKDKEKIKQIKQNVDVLTLSATPIPRTLQMSLTGLRKMSLLQTPPINRVPIQTYVVEKNKYLIKEVIERELVRDGQVFYLHNKTSNIEEVADSIEKMFDDVKVAVIHGKMPKSAVEKVMEKFDNNEYNILVCTTIIETGIDIPNANTIIIEDANKFGLSQLYQIKGRVGRSDRVGYAYLMYEKDKIINEEAQKRLQAIKELTKLGSGYKIALRDLAIRGAGDILGKSQAGNIETVGYEMYLDLLQDVIDKRKNIKRENTEIDAISIKNTGYIPNDFILDDENKINLYQRIYNVKNLKEFNVVVEEIRDIYGKLPSSIIDLIDKRKFEIIVNRLKDIKVFDEMNKITIQVPIDINDKEKLKEVFKIVDDYGSLVAVEIKYNKVHLVVNKFPSFLKTINNLIFDLRKYYDKK